MMIILIDMDGTIADIGTPLEREIRAKFPNAQRSTKRHFYMEQDFGLGHDDTRSIFEAEHFFLNLPLMPGAQEGVAKLMERHEVFICTSPVISRYCTAEKMQWVDRYFPDLVRRIIVSKDKTVIHGDLLIDDKPEINGVRQPDWRLISYKHPYNDGWFTWSRTDKLLSFLDERVYA